MNLEILTMDQFKIKGTKRY